ncbi:unnamed protein product [Protopolystoma xenopodis]|uniref:N-acetyltransferase domain-containing protein n=1 Tax=Protopolystoma xenopodis TaxID=117903 RepID=A0A3S5CQ46_9PLAT|nr:unnamed protein product [Protopolystoma xenopodis]
MEAEKESSEASVASVETDEPCLAAVSSAEVGEIVRVFILPAWRKHGLGSRLMGHLEAHARQRAGYRRLKLETSQFQDKARLMRRDHLRRLFATTGCF